MKESRSRNTAARKVVLLKIRCTLVRNPYDVGGRRLAILAKNVFLRKVLNEHKWFHRITDYFIIPNWLKKIKGWKYFYNHLGLCIAALIVLQGAAIYWYDIYSDYAVIEDISKTENEFRIPKFSDVPQATSNISEFIFKSIEIVDARSLKDPCYVLTWLEDFVRHNVPLYNYFIYRTSGLRVSKLATYHTKNRTIDDLDASDALELGENLLLLFQDVSKTVKNQNWTKTFDLAEPSKSIDAIVKYIKDLGVESSMLDENVMDYFFYKDEIEYVKAPIKTAKELIHFLEESKRLIFNLDISKNIVMKMNKLYVQIQKKYLHGKRIDNALPAFITIIRELKMTLNRTFIENNPYKPKRSCDPYFEEINSNLTKRACRDFIHYGIKIATCKSGDKKMQKACVKIREVIKMYLKDANSTTNLDQMTKSIERNLKLATTYSFECIRLYLIIVMVHNLGRALMICISDFVHHRITPGVTKFAMIKKIMNPRSDIYSKTPMLNKDVVAQSTKYDGSINEATDETLRAVSIQIAFLLYLNTVIFIFQDCWSSLVAFVNENQEGLQINQTAEEKCDFEYLAFDSSLHSKYALPIENFGLKPETLNFFKSPVYPSLIAGMISLTFAQYHLYNLRHSGDLEIVAKMVYMFTCILNTCSIFLSYAMYYAIGLPTFLLTLVIIVRRICGLGDYEIFPESDHIILGVLIVGFAIIPLIMLPKYVGNFLDMVTNYFILPERLHEILGYRIGYDVPGVHHATFMFLPQAYQNYRNPRSSSADALVKAFNSDESSRKFYRLRFQLQVLNKLAMHWFYFVFSAVFLHMICLLIEMSGITKAVFYLYILEVPAVRYVGKCNFYSFFHFIFSSINHFDIIANVIMYGTIRFQFKFL